MASRTIAAGSKQAFMIDCDGKPWVWGKLNWGEVEPTQFPTDCSFRSVYCGINTGFLIDMDSQLWEYGAAPTQIYQKMELPPIKAVATYSESSLFLDTESNVWVLGINYYGQLGLGTTIRCEIPRKIENLPTITAVAAGHSHSLFLDNCNAVWCCGSNSCGELGIKSYENLMTPAKVAYLPPIGSLCAGFFVSYFLDLEGNVWSCGKNTTGQQGLGKSDRDKAEQIAFSQANVFITSVATGFDHALFLDSQEKVWGCGSSLDGQLQDIKCWIWEPVQLALEGLKICEIAAGDHFSVFMDTEGKIWTRGKNQSGQLGRREVGCGGIGQVEGIALAALKNFSRVKSARGAQ